MNQFLCLIFDENAHLQHRVPMYAVSSAPNPPELLKSSAEPDPALKEAEQQFLGSLRIGDRKHFVQFCATPLQDHSVSTPCELFSVLGFPPFRYAFCEKNLSGDRMLNTVYLAEKAHSFYRMMSPASLQCSRLSDRLTREILLCIGHPNPQSLSLTSETILALQYLPNVLHSLMEPNNGIGLCDVERITEIVVTKLQETPPFRNTTLSIRQSDGIPSQRMIKLSAEVYVHLLLSILTALLSISADHVLQLEVLPFNVASAVTAEGFPVQKTLSVDVKITAKLRDPYEYWNDSEHLSALAAPDSTTETMLAAASVLAAAANIDPSYYINYAEQTLQLFLTIHPSTAPVEEHNLPEFRFRDPYQSVSTILKEFFDFLGAI